MSFAIKNNYLGKKLLMSNTFNWEERLSNFSQLIGAHMPLLDETISDEDSHKYVFMGAHEHS